MKGDIAFLQARLRSSRLPGKVLMPLQGTPVIRIILERLKRSKELDGVVLLTSDSPENDVLAYLVEGYGVPCFRGSEEDVLDRFYRAALVHRPRNIVRLTGDCPLIDPEIIDGVLRFYHREQADFVSNQLSDSFPDGLDVSVFSYETLTLAWKNASLPSEREHVTPWITKSCRSGSNGLSKALDYPCDEDMSRERWTLDEGADYIFLDRLSKHLSGSLIEVSWREVREVVVRHPELKAINHHILRNEGYMKSLAEDRKHGA